MATVFEFKKLIDNKGFFFKIEYEVTITEELEETLRFSEDSKWNIAISFALHYFFEKYSRARGKGIRLTVYGFEDQIVDTTSMVVFYSIIQLLAKETDFSIIDLMLTNKGELILPK
jgi:hypothetical protein